MGKRKRKKRNREPRGGPARTQSTAPTRPAQPDNTRETVESIVLAFIMAFLFWTFEAEGFEIPTGSMAPTLMGRHKDVICPQCGFEYRVGASHEVNDVTGQRLPNDVVGGTCPMCRYSMAFADLETGAAVDRSYKGDRIWVSKGNYRFAPPARWDVAVFKYPEAAIENYIKRVVGLPGETLRIRFGDIFVRRLNDDDFVIERKPPIKIRALLQPVYDNDYRVPLIEERGWPPRWQAWSAAAPTAGPAAADAAGWTADDEGRAFVAKPRGEGAVWLRYQHIVPSYEDWQLLAAGPLPADHPRRPQLVSDFCHYNSGRYQQHGARVTTTAPDPVALGLHWVGDLAVACQIEVSKPEGAVVLELVEGGKRFQCRIDLSTGSATLGIVGVESFKPTAQTTVAGGGTYRLMFANVDDQLCLWVDDEVVDFDVETGYPRLRNTIPSVDDLAPVGIGSEGAAVEVSHLQVFRDVYYIAGELFDRGNVDYEDNPYLFNYRRGGYDRLRSVTPEAVADFMSSPSKWDVFERMGEVTFPLGEDQFLVLGDNSPNSKDSRFWEVSDYYVDRELFKGKAYFIYWPHGWDTAVSLPIPFTERRFPFYPNFKRMGWIH